MFGAALVVACGGAPPEAAAPREVTKAAPSTAPLPTRERPQPPQAMHRLRHLRRPVTSWPPISCARQVPTSWTTSVTVRVGCCGPRARVQAGVEAHSAPAPLDAVLLILRGRKTLWPAHGCYRTSPPGAPFSGQHFRIEAVYQRTVDELMARPGSFWLVFTCLAADANVEKMRLVIDEIRRREACEADRDELYLTLLTLAELDPWGHHLQEEIKAMLLSPEMQEVMKAKWVREVVALNREDALEEGMKKGRKEGIKKGVTKGIKKGKKALIEEMLHHQLVRQLRRELTPAEQQALSARAGTLSGPEVAELLAHAGSGSLSSWLLGQDA